MQARCRQACGMQAGRRWDAGCRRDAGWKEDAGRTQAEQSQCLQRVLRLLGQGGIEGKEEATRVFCLDQLLGRGKVRG